MRAFVLSSRRVAAAAVVALAYAAAAGCGDDTAAPPDSGAMDAGRGDAAGTDAGGVADDASACTTVCRPGTVCCPVGLVSQCVAPRPGGGCPLPDLTVDSDTLRRDLSFSWEQFDPEACEIVEGCIETPGWRRLMRFSTQTPNIGDGDMHIGRPSDTNPNFEYSSCHMHYHFNGYADYRLLDASGTEVGHGSKRAFCLLDSERVATSASSTPRYTCDDQGIQHGWSDIYGSGLPCQWIDVTGLASGDYRLRVTINYEHILPESSYDNNEVEIPVMVPADVPTDPTLACMGGIEGPSRECGWQVDATRACAPGATVAVGCGAACAHGSGCAGDPMVRVCPGDTPCNGREALGSDDDSCGDYCPLATFTCPAGGVYTVLVGSYSPTDAATCRTTSVGGAVDGGVPGDAGPPDAGPSPDDAGGGAAADAGVPDDAAVPDDAG